MIQSCNKHFVKGWGEGLWRCLAAPVNREHRRKRNSKAGGFCINSIVSTRTSDDTARRAPLTLAASGARCRPRLPVSLFGLLPEGLPFTGSGRPVCGLFPPPSASRGGRRPSVCRSVHGGAPWFVAFFFVRPAFFAVLALWLLGACFCCASMSSLVVVWLVSAPLVFPRSWSFAVA